MPFGQDFELPEFRGLAIKGTCTLHLFKEKNAFSKSWEKWKLKGIFLVIGLFKIN